MSSQSAGNIDVGAVFERVLSTYGKTWKVLIMGALIVFAPIALLAGLLVASGGGLAFLAVAAAIVGTFWYQGMVVETVRDVQDGTVDSSVGQLFSSVTPVLGTLIGVGFLAVLGLAVGFILLIIPGLILLTIWAVVAPVVVIEKKGAFESFGRSRELVRGNGWQVFGVLVALFALNIALSIVASIIGAAGDGVAIVAQLLQSLAFAPVSALAAAILYFALREAHGDAALANPTGVLSGGFTPPVPPPAPADPVAAQPEAPAPAPAFEPPAPVAAPDPPLSQPGTPAPEAPAPAEAPAAPVSQPAPPTGQPAPPAPAPDPPLGQPAPPAPAPDPPQGQPAPPAPAPDPPLSQPTPPAATPDPPLSQPGPPRPAEGNEAAEGAFGESDAPSDPFGAPEGGDRPAPRDPGESVPPPGWKPPGS